MTERPTIIYTQTDEAPALATYSLLPIVSAFSKHASVDVESRDISLSGRILAAFSDQLPHDQAIDDALAELGKLAQTPAANIIKLPNISASQPQLIGAIKELQAQGFALPDFPSDPQTESERNIRARYDKVKGSAVNPVLREGNSDRRAPKAVKEFAKKNPHRMGKWSSDSKTHVATMRAGDFFHNERSLTVDAKTTVSIEWAGSDGTTKKLKEGIHIEAGEIIDASFLSKSALKTFLADEISDAKKQGVLFSLHMKATMMKVSDPIIFGHAVRVFFDAVFSEHGAALESVGVNPNNGFADVLNKITNLPTEKRVEIETAVENAFAQGPAIAMVDSDKGITNLHVPNDVIIDASMPAMIRTSGQMWNAEGETQDTKAVIPDSSYAAVYQEVISFCKKHGAFDPTTMGSVSNVGLMAKKAEEYGSHDKTFEIEEAGTVRIVDAGGATLTEHNVMAGDIWRMCQVKDGPVRDWVKLAVARARATHTPAVFWLDENRPHDAQLIKKVKTYLADHDIDGLELPIMSPEKATAFSLQRVKDGNDTVSATGNVLRDYLTDLFPILELGTSAKMLSIVPLMNGGGLFETGAGGSAPKHVQQFEKENHLRWDSLGEFLALAVSFDHIGDKYDHPLAKLFGATLDEATTRYLLENKAPSRKVGELDNRGSHYYLATYWAQALAKQDEHAEMKSHFSSIAQALADNEPTILSELNGVQGQAVDLKGYFRPDAKLAQAAMRPSATLNEIVAKI